MVSEQSRTMVSFPSAVRTATLAAVFVHEVADGELAAEGRGFFLLESGHGGDRFGDAGPLNRRRGGKKACDGLAVAGDGEGLAVFNPFEQLGQVRLRLV